MFSEPDDPAARQRMHDAFAAAVDGTGCARGPDAMRAWGYRGRTFGAPVRYDGARAWLRVMEAPAHKRGGKLRTGTAEAAEVVPAGVPRPRLVRTLEWAGDGYAYRAELTTYIGAPVCSSTPDLTATIALPTEWFTHLHAVLTLLTATTPPPGRPTVITQEYVHRAIRRYVGDVGVDTDVRRWSLAHGDLHWANLTAPDLNMLDWEGFGPAPHGFDAANLHAYSLPVPDVAARIRVAFADTLNTPEAGWPNSRQPR